MRPNFIMLVGLPGSGKSTYRERFYDHVQLSTDDLIEVEAGRQGRFYDAVWAEHIDTATKMLNGHLANALRERQSIVYDRTNLTEKSRRKVLSQVPKEYIKTVVYFEVSEPVRQSRMASRVGKFIPPAADAQMISWYCRPVLEEGFDYVINGVETQAAFT